jgi:uncharacterized membrane protein
VTERLECERCGTRDGTVQVRQLRHQSAPLCDLCDAALHGTLGPQPSRMIIVAFAVAVVGFAAISAIVIVLVS